MSNETGPEGLHDKFRVERLIPSSRGIDHADCRYFVLDPKHDTAAVAALRLYARTVRGQGKTELANDLDAWVLDLLDSASLPAHSPHSSKTWNVRLADGTLSFAHGTSESVSRERAASLPGSTLVARRFIPAHDTGWTEL